MSLDYIWQYELTHCVRPRADKIHVAFVNRIQPRDEVDDVALIHLPEDIVKRMNHFCKRGIVVVKTRTAHVLGEHVEAGGLNQGFHFIFLRFLCGTWQFGEELNNFVTPNLVKVVVVDGSEAWGAVDASNAAPGLLEIGPVTESQGWNVTSLKYSCPIRKTYFDENYVICL